MKQSYIQSRIRLLRSQRMMGCVSNYLGMFDSKTGEVDWLAETDSSIVFGIKENENLYLYFYGLKEEIVKLFISAPSGSIINCITKKREEYNWILEGGFTKNYELLRYYNNDLPSIHISDNQQNDHLSKIEYASVSDTDEINELIRLNFDTINAHFIDRNELKNRIENQYVWCYRENDRITGFIVTYPEGKKICLNYLYNHSRNISGKILETKAMIDIAARGVQYGYLWVDSGYPKAINVHQSLSFEFDGTYNIIFVSCTK